MFLCLSKGWDVSLESSADACNDVTYSIDLYIISIKVLLINFRSHRIS